MQNLYNFLLPGVVASPLHCVNGKSSMSGLFIVMENEIWKDVAGYEGYYQVSNLGNVRSLRRTVKHNYGGDKILQPRICKIRHIKKYRNLGLAKLGVSKNKRVCRLVATAFVPNPENKPFVNHIDGDASNDRATNLEWVTSQENTDHAWKTGLISIPSGSANPMFGRKGLKNNSAIKLIDSAGNFACIKEAAKVYGCSNQHMSRMIAGIRKNKSDFKIFVDEK